MIGLVKLMGIIMLVSGVIYFVKPNSMKKILKYFMKEKNLTVGGVIAIVFGFILLRAASQCSVGWIVVIVALLALAKGILIFVLGKQKVVALMETIMNNPPKTLRKLVLINIVLGVALIYAA